jgi:hypothetical protein
VKVRVAAKRVQQVDVFYRCPGCWKRTRCGGWDRRAQTFLPPINWHRQFWCSTTCRLKRPKRGREPLLSIPAKHVKGSGNRDMAAHLPKLYKWVDGVLTRRKT